MSAVVPDTLAVVGLDGVSVDLVHDLREFEVGRGRDHSEMPEPTTWDFGSSWGYPEGIGKLISEAYDAKAIFWNGTLLPGALEGFGLLAETPSVATAIITARTIDIDGLATKSWVEKNQIDVDHVIVTDEKVNHAAALAKTIGADRIFAIDDKPSQFAAYVDAGFYAVLANHDCNSHIRANLRASTLARFARIVEGTAVGSPGQIEDLLSFRSEDA